jgi:pimeloyl-ACP methyl ester carboxylesterase
MDNGAADLAANFAEWGIEKPHVVGNSLGGAIALELGARGLVSSVTVLSPAGFFGRFNRYQALIPLSVMRIASQVPDRLLFLVSRTPLGRRLVGFMLYSHPERISAEATYGDSLALKRAKAFFPTAKAGVGYEFASPVPVPTTVAWGTKDKLLPYSQAARARKVLPDALHVPLVGCGHVPMSDSPDLIVTLIKATVARATALKAA